MKKYIHTIPVFVLSILLLSFGGDKGQKSLKIGAKAPLADVKMKGIDNSMISLADAKKGNGLVVVFSCNTCPFVVGMDEFPGWEKDYNELNKIASSNDLGFVLVNSNEAKRGDDDSFENMKTHAQKTGYEMPYLVDENSQLANAFGAKTTPHVYLFDATMKLVYSGSIDNTWDTKRANDESYLKNAMAEIKNGKITVNDAKPVGCSIKRLAVEK